MTDPFDRSSWGPGRRLEPLRLRLVRGGRFLRAETEGRCPTCGGGGCAACASTLAAFSAVQASTVPARALVVEPGLPAGQYKVRDVRGDRVVTVADATRAVADWVKGAGPLTLGLAGPPGAGKTTAALAAARALVMRGVVVDWVDAPGLIEEMQAAADRRWGEGEGHAVNLGQIARVGSFGRVLVLDNIGGDSGWWRRLYDSVLMPRVDLGLPMILTWSCHRDDLAAALGQRLAHRLYERMISIGFLRGGA